MVARVLGRVPVSQVEVLTALPHLFVDQTIDAGSHNHHKPAAKAPGLRAASPLVTRTALPRRRVNRKIDEENPNHHQQDVNPLDRLVVISIVAPTALPHRRVDRMIDEENSNHHQQDADSLDRLVVISIVGQMTGAASSHLFAAVVTDGGTNLFRLTATSAEDAEIFVPPSTSQAVIAATSARHPAVAVTIVVGLNQ